MPDILDAPFALFLSAVASALVGVASFVAGVRAGKDQADRATVRELYSDLFRHFQKLAERIDRGKPLQWSFFDRKDGKYMPLVRTMEHDGRLNMLSSSVSKMLIKVEYDVLNEAWRYNNWLSEELLDASKSAFVSVTNSKRALEGQPYCPLSISQLGLLNDKEKEAIRKRLDEEGLGLGLDLAIDPPETDPIFAYSSKLTDQTMASLWDALCGHTQTSAGADARSRMSEVRGRLQTAIELLGSRIREPLPLIGFASRSLGEFQ